MPREGVCRGRTERKSLARKELAMSRRTVARAETGPGVRNRTRETRPVSAAEPTGDRFTELAQSRHCRASRGVQCWTPPMRLRLRWPLALLLVSIGVTALAAWEAQRAFRSQRATAERALQEYASFAAWSYQQHLRERLEMLAREALGAVNHGEGMHTSPRIPAAFELAHYL